jgi:hypothetical protein
VATHDREVINEHHKSDDDDDDTKTLVGEPESPVFKTPRGGFPRDSNMDMLDPANQDEWGLAVLLKIKSIQRMLWSLFLLS